MGGHLSAYGARARLGAIVPPTNTVNEAEWARLVPDGVTFHVMRMNLHADTSSEAGKAALMADIGKALAGLLPCRPDVVAYACTAGSMVVPSKTMPETIAGMAGRPAVTTADAIVEALEALGATRVSVATPYHRALNDHEAHFLEESGFAVARIGGLGIGAGGPAEYIRIAETPLATVADHARACFVPDSDALLISCTDFPTLPLIAALEVELGVPVISSNTATLWACLRLAGIGDDIPAGGRLFTLPGPANPEHAKTALAATR
jgi:maleate isomerase/arylmalonate decarboxylase